MTPQRRRLRWLLAAAAAASMLSACGGGGGGAGGGGGGVPPPAATCTVAEQKSWLRDYMNEWYFWYALAPRPDPAPYNDVQSYFDALLYTGTNATFPRDRWSGNESTESFNRFFGDGNSLGYGVSVAGLEAVDDPALPLFVRYVEPRSPAGLAGVRRGDRVLSINGRSAESVIAANDFAALTANAAGDALTLVLRRGTDPDRSVSLTAAVFPLSPVPESRTLTTPGGRRVGYLVVKDMISQSLAPMETAFAQFKAAGVQDLVLDLRYNGGGLVSTAGTLSSYVAGERGQGQVFARLLYNDKRAASNNSSFTFSSQISSLGLPRVFVLMGRRTCSASEQVINGLRGVGVQVVAIGETSCGKPVGFLPASSCGRTYSVVNFESVNARNEGRYFDGFDASCPVTENFSTPAGREGDPLFDGALSFADLNRCGRLATGSAVPLRAGRLKADGQRRAEGRDGGEEHGGMLGR